MLLDCTTLSHRKKIAEKVTIKAGGAFRIFASAHCISNGWFERFILTRMGGWGAGRIVCREDHMLQGWGAGRIVCREDRVPGGWSAGRIVCREDSLPGGWSMGRMVCWEDSVPGG